MKIAALIASRNRPDLVESLVQQLRGSSIELDVYVVECGSRPGNLSAHATLWYPDDEPGPGGHRGGDRDGFRGKCFGHHLALQQARAAGPYDYYWVLMNDLVFEDGAAAARTLVETMEREPRMAILSPTCEDGLYPGSARRPGGGWRPVTTVDYLGFMMRAEAVEEVGFLNPAFTYCWGAIHELAYKLYSSGRFVAYSDDVTYRHLGGSTYGAQGTKTISREEYQREARRFAYDYFLETYGAGWAERFFAATAGHAIEIDTFAEHERLWAEGFSAEELAFRARRARTSEKALLPRETAPDGSPLVRLHLGCGPEYREGWINVDGNTEVRTDLCSSVVSLPSVADASVDVIEANHLFEHLPHHEAVQALAEWRRMLRPGGELFLELPDLDACIRLLGRHADDQGWDLGLIGIYGWPPAIEREGPAQIHKWGWTRESLGEALREAGFETVEFGPITQTWRPAAKIGRDMRVRACRPAAASSVPNANGAPTVTARLHETFPLATQAPVKLLAWPDYGDAAELDALFQRFGALLAERPGVCLCLRHDPRVDGDDASATAALDAAFRRTLGEGRELSLLLVNDPVEGDDWRRLGATVDGVLLLPSSSESPRAEAIARTRARTVASGERLRALLDELGSTSATNNPSGQASETPAPRNADGHDTEEILNKVDWRLVEQIGELNPWTYPAILGNLRVHPGKGTSHTSEYLEERTRRLARLVLHTAEVDFEGRALLELGCDCAFWSARAVELGARTVVGVDRSERKLRQAELYFSRNAFLSPEDRTFLQGDVEEAATWERIARLGPYDVTLCVGLLERAEDPGALLRRAADATKETLVVVTRLAQADRLVETLVPLGFEGTFEDDLEAGLTAWVARRTGVVLPSVATRASSAA